MAGAEHSRWFEGYRKAHGCGDITKVTGKNAWALLGGARTSIHEELDNTQGDTAVDREESSRTRTKPSAVSQAALNVFGDDGREAEGREMVDHNYVGQSAAHRCPRSNPTLSSARVAVAVGWPSLAPQVISI